MTGERNGALLCHHAWAVSDFADDLAAQEINDLIDLVTGIRSVRAEMNVPAGAKAPLVIVGADAAAQTRLKSQESALGKLARVTEVQFADDVPNGSAQIVLDDATACLPLGQLIDIEAETARLNKAIEKASLEAAKFPKNWVMRVLLRKRRKRLSPQNARNSKTSMRSSYSSTKQKQGSDQCLKHKPKRPHGCLKYKNTQCAFEIDDNLGVVVFLPQRFFFC